MGGGLRFEPTSQKWVLRSLRRATAAGTLGISGMALSPILSMAPLACIFGDEVAPKGGCGVVVPSSSAPQKWSVHYGHSHPYRRITAHNLESGDCDL